MTKVFLTNIVTDTHQTKGKHKKTTPAQKITHLTNTMPCVRVTQT